MDSELELLSVPYVVARKRGLKSEVFLLCGGLCSKNQNVMCKVVVLGHFVFC